MSEARQRWRLIVARGEAARNQVQRDVTVAWEAAFRASGLPVAETEGTVPRLRVAYGAPVSVGMLAEREPIDLALFERCRIHEVRESLERVMPTGYLLVELYDVWPGAPTLAASIVAGDYRAEVSAAGGSNVSRDALGTAVAALLDAASVFREREKAGSVVKVDIRPHILALRLDEAVAAVEPTFEPRAVATVEPTFESRAVPALDGSLDLLMRLRLGGEGGVGRPDEVVAALAERLGRPLTTHGLRRERVILTDGPA